MRSVLIIAKQILKFYHLPKSIYIFNNSYSFLIIWVMVTMHSLLLMCNSSSSVPWQYPDEAFYPFFSTIFNLLVFIFLTVGKKRGICTCGQCSCKRGYIGSNCGEINCTLKIEKCLNKGVCVVVIKMYFTINSNHAVAFYQRTGWRYTFTHCH